jgi:hypothetical protein
MSTLAATEHVYRYLAPSEVAGGACRLATSGGAAEHPWLAEGFLAAPQPAARALLAVAGVAGKRFWTPPGMVAAAIAAADPVVTTSSEALRFESFSQCCGVYARFDLPADAFDGQVHRHGTTNVDVNPALRAALARVGARDPLRLRVGADEIAVTTIDGQVIERRVPLPERWVRGFAEVSVALSSLEPVFELGAAGLRRFLDALPTSPTRGPGWVVPSGPTARVSSRPGGGGVAAGGVERLRFLRELAPFVSSLTALGPVGAGAGEGASAWIAAVEGGRLTVAISPAASRGFSGEGGLLHALAAADHAADRRIEQAGVGRLGYDSVAGSWFARDLPFDRSSLGRPGTRLANARTLVAAGAVEAAGAGHVVRSGTDEYRVRQVDGDWRCTCPWWARHGADRGPCKHVLAVVLDARSRA